MLSATQPKLAASTTWCRPTLASSRQGSPSQHTRSLRIIEMCFVRLSGLNGPILLRRAVGIEEIGFMASRRILLVEDSSTMRRMLAMMLKEEDFDVKTANDGAEGLAKAREEPRPELILTDYEMPELDGAGLCQEIKKDKELRSIPVLMLTTLGETQNKIAGLEAGADDYIQKPKSPDEVQEMFARIRAQLRTADLRLELAERNRLLEVGPQEVDVRARAGAEGPVRPDASAAQAPGSLASGRPVHAGQPARRRRL